MRLIDADVLHKAYMELRNFKQDPQSGDWISLRAVPLTTVIRMLNDAPSIDIIRCQDCRYRYMDADLQVWTCTYGLMIKPDGFCNYGEREGE